jgi:phage FluMu protein Com
VALPAPEGATATAPSLWARCPHCKKRNAFHRDETIQGRNVTLTLRCIACQRVFTFNTVAA